MSAMTSELIVEKIGWDERDLDQMLSEIAADIEKNFESHPLGVTVLNHDAPFAHLAANTVKMRARSSDGVTLKKQFQSYD